MMGDMMVSVGALAQKMLSYKCLQLKELGIFFAQVASIRIYESVAHLLLSALNNNSITNGNDK